MVFCLCWLSSPVSVIDLAQCLYIYAWAPLLGLIVVFKGDTTLPWYGFIVVSLIGG